MNTENDTNVEQISDLIKGNLSEVLKGEVVQSGQYVTPEEYLRGTGKRFRMTREQKTRGITRAEAFAEFMKTYQG